MKAHLTMTSTTTTDEAMGGTLFADAKAWFGAIAAKHRANTSARALRRELAEMDEALLRDIGIDEGEIWKIRQARSPLPLSW